MTIEIAMVNLLVQILLLTTISIAVYMAKKLEHKKHCFIMRITLPVQVIAIALVMLPSMLGYIQSEDITFKLRLEYIIRLEL